jgi:hypothetical protein
MLLVDFQKDVYNVIPQKSLLEDRFTEEGFLVSFGHAQ